MTLLSRSGIGDQPMDFYSYHHYETPATTGLVRCGRLDDAALSGVEKLRLIRAQHDEMLKELNLPDLPVFLNELGKARTTGVDGDALYNAAGLITYLLAFGCEDAPKLYPFPWGGQGRSSNRRNFRCSEHLRCANRCGNQIEQHQNSRKH